MKKMLILLGLIAMVTVVTTGCASVQTAVKMNDQKLETTENANVAHINGSTWGVYLLWIPILTGSTEKIGSTNFNVDDVKLEPVVNMVTKKSKEMGAVRLTDMQSDVTSRYIPPVFFVEEVEVSGNAVK